MDKRKVARFYELLTHKCWNRIVNRIRDTKKWLALLQLAAYNIIYIMVMCGVLMVYFLTILFVNFVLTCREVCFDKI